MQTPPTTARKPALGGVAGLALLAVLAAACSGSSTGPGGGGHTTAIDAIGTSFSPANDTVAVGATVTWTIRSGGPHTVTANDGSFDSGSRTDGETFQHTFGAAGSYPYYCQFHGTPTSGMRGVIVVK